MNWCRAEGGHILLHLHIQPGAKKTEITGLHGESLKIRLAAPPVDGRANESLIAFLAETLALPKNRIELISGQASRSKRIHLSDCPMTVTEVQTRLLPSR